MNGERTFGGFVIITGTDGSRYAVRRLAVAIIHDAEKKDETLIQLSGGHVVRVPYSFDEVLPWFDESILQRGPIT